MDLGSTLKSSAGLILDGSISAEFDGLVRHFTPDKGVQLVQASGTFEHLARCCSRFAASVLVIGSRSPKALDSRPIQRFRYENPAARLILYLEEPHAKPMEDFLLLGYYGFILPDTPAPLWEKMVRRVLSDEMWVNRQVLTRAFQRMIAIRNCELTHKETAILGLVADGLNNSDIADRLFVTPETIRWHLRRVYSKTGVRTRTELLRFATNCIGLPSEGARAEVRSLTVAAR